MNIRENIKSWSKELRRVTNREAKETKVSIRILIKIINSKFGNRKNKVTKEEIEFLKKHSKDIAKIIPIIVMFPTPIPYIEILLLLKTMGIDVLLPNNEDLKIPDTRS